MRRVQILSIATLMSLIFAAAVRTVAGADAAEVEAERRHAVRRKGVADGNDD